MSEESSLDGSRALETQILRLMELFEVELVAIWVVVESNFENKFT
jgi:hypothetical protein